MGASAKADRAGGLRPEPQASQPKALIPCVICGERLRNFDERGNQPLSGTEFVTQGHYGSAVTDFCDGTATIINVCDGCLRGAISLGRVVTYRCGKYELWQPAQWTDRFDPA